MSGCASNNLVSYDYSNPNPKKGLVVFSLVERGFLNTTLGNDVKVHYRKVGSDDMGIVPDLLFDGPIMNNIKGDVDHFEGEELGKVYIMELEPGNYEFTNWRVVTGNQYVTLSYENPTEVSYRFKVAPGDVKYIGELGIKYHSVENFMNMEVLGGGKFFFENMAERDIKVASEKYPNIDFSKINVEVFNTEI